MEHRLFAGATDSHVHIFPQRIVSNPEVVASRDPWFAACHARKGTLRGPADLIEMMDSAGIVRAGCTVWPFADPVLCDEANEFLLGVARDYPGRILPFAILQPNDPSAVAKIRTLAARGFVGIGELNQDAQGWSLDDTGELAPFFEEMAAAGLICNLHCSEPVGHMYPGKGTATPDRVWRFAGRFPGLRLLCSHLGGGLPFFASMPEVRESLSHIFFDTSALPFLYTPRALQMASNLIGTGRMVYGSDFPLLGPARYNAYLVEAGLSPEELQDILVNNPATLFLD